MSGRRSLEFLNGDLVLGYAQAVGITPPPAAE
jgi:hypothetical protein